MTAAQSPGPRTYAEQSSLTETQRNKCLGCEHYFESVVFDLCGHPSSLYRVGDREDWHTIGHMRGPRGSCGQDTKLFIVKGPK